MTGPKLVELPAAQNKDAALEVLDRLRADIVPGRVAAFYGVSVDHDDTTECWCASTTRVSRLRMMGAVSYLLACMHSGEA